MYRTPLGAPYKHFLLNPKKKQMAKSQKINRSLMKTFKCPFPIDIAVIMSILRAEHSTQLETIFFSEAFLVVVIHQYFLFVYMEIKTYISFTCVNPFCFYSFSLLPLRLTGVDILESCWKICPHPDFFYLFLVSVTVDKLTSK